MDCLQSNPPILSIRRPAAMLAILFGLILPAAAQTTAPASQPAITASATVAGADQVPQGVNFVDNENVTMRMDELTTRQIVETFAKATGMPLELEVPLSDRTATVRALSPISVTDAIEVINTILSPSGQAIVHDGNRLRVMAQGNEKTPLAIAHEKMMVLAGIATEDGRYVAYVRDNLPQPAKILRLESGDGILDGIVVDVAADRMVVNRRGKRMEVKVGQNFEN